MTSPSFLVRGILCAALVLVAGCSVTTSDSTDGFTRWTRYEGEPGGASFSALDQIDRTNVGRLEIAWKYSTPGAAGINPLVADSFMYVMSGDDAIVALHAGTGEPLWSHTSAVGGVRANGLMYWESGDRSERRVFYPEGGYSIAALDGFTGEPVAEFGDGGVLDLREGLGIDRGLVARATSPSPGTVYEDLLIMGSAPGEGYFAAPGHIRAFDVHTGEQQWIFHTLPQDGEFGYDTWPPGRSDQIIDGQAFGGANAWGGLSVDTERGMVFVPVGSANYDFYGVDRPGQNLFANSLVALDARTGERLWHFQTVHHDLWDYDLTATPVLLTVEHDGAAIDVVAQATKTGQVFVFDRESGEPLWPIEERAVPASTMQGEQSWPTQPFPTRPEPFVPTEFNVDTDLSPYLSGAERDSITQAIQGMLFEGMFTPPSTQPTFQIPGNRGGANWGSTAANPDEGIFYVLSYNMPSVLQLHRITAGATGTGGSPIDQGQGVYTQNCRICHGQELQGQPASGIPSLVDVTDRLSHDDFEQVVRSGSGTMPAFPQLNEDQFEALRMYLSNPELALTSSPQESEGEVAEPAGPVRYQSGWNHVYDSRGIPVIKPPWFRLTAYDLNDGSMKWQVPVGDVPHLVERGIENTGSGAWIRGGPAVTAGGLIFQGSGDRLEAYDSETGEKAWSQVLPGLVSGIPAIYAVDGKQYVAIPVTAGSFFQPAPTETVEPGYVAFALPE